MLKLNLTVKEVAEIINGTIILHHNIMQPISDILIDSRRLINPDGCLFFALISKRNNGHNFIDELYQKSIFNFIISEIPENLDRFSNANFILVDNTLKALQTLSIAHRKKFKIPVIGITGSNGKTIVKEWLYQLLNEDKKIVRSPKSFNSQIGVPLSVLQMKAEDELAIFEAGLSEPDEMDKLGPIILPDIGIFTNIGQAHDENFINQSQKINEKLKLFLKAKTIIYCYDYLEIRDRLITLEVFKNTNIFAWSRKHPTNLQIINIAKTTKQTNIKGRFKGTDYNITIPFTDEASIENAIHCWATMLVLSYSHEIIAQRMLSLSPVAMRLELKEGINNCSIINDSYNSDINSLSIAIDFLNQQNQHKKKTIIMSDILQSGKTDYELYSEVANLLHEKGISNLIGIGPAIGKQINQFKIEKSFYETTSDFIKYYSLSSFQNESILLKGARKFEFEQINLLLQQKAHETVLEINLNALVNNLNYYKGKIKPGVKIMAMVKAFSYGSGSFEIANVLQFHNIDYLAVAYADEGVELRKAGINSSILVMNPDGQSFDSIIKYNLEAEIYSFRVLGLLENAIVKNAVQDSPVPIHIKLDTGMHRLGFLKEDLSDLIIRIKNNPQLYVKSIFSHLAASDDAVHDEFTRKQIQDFEIWSLEIMNNFNYPILQHILNSSGISRFPDAQFDMVRLGIALYGIPVDDELDSQLQNVSTLKSIISQIKSVPKFETIGYGRSWITKIDTKIATIPVGYADGLDRKFSNGKGKVLINGEYAQIVGNVCMDMCMVDISNIKCKEGDEVILFGNGLPIIELAKTIDTIPYEILTGIPPRVKRVYFHE